MGRHFKPLRGMDRAEQRHVRRAVELSRDPDGCAIVARPAGDGWLAFVPEGKGKERMALHAAQDRLIGVYRMTRGMTDERMAAAMVEDITAALG